jgi:hypothetical protein
MLQNLRNKCNRIHATLDILYLLVFLVSSVFCNIHLVALGGVH